MRTVFGSMIIPFCLAVKHHDYLTSHVVRRQQCGDYTNNVKPAVVGINVEQNFVLRPKARKWRHTRNCKPADDKCNCSNWHCFAQRAHTTHVLLVMHAMNNRTRAEEQQSFKECVSDHVENGRNICARTDRQEHEAKLRHR